MITKLWRNLLPAFLLAGATAEGGLFTYISDMQESQVIPNAHLVGCGDTRAISGLGSCLNGVSVPIVFSGGHNEDLCAYLAYDGILVPQLNRVSTATATTIKDISSYSTAHFENVRQADAGSLNIQSDGNPGASPTYSNRLHEGNLALFSSIDPNGL